MHVENDLIELFQRLVPGCDRQWEGADEDQIDEYESYIGQPLPAFYRWFLMTMGQHMGPLVYPQLDMSIETLLAIYRSGYRAQRDANTTMMVVASDPDEVMPTYYYCDLSRPARNDALVCCSHPQGGHLQDEFETLREALAWHAFYRHRIKVQKQVCSGTFKHPGRHLLDEIEPVLKDVGFETYHRTGTLCGLYARDDVAVACDIMPTKAPRPYIFFTFGGEELSIRHTLGLIGTKTTVSITVKRWDPPLSV
jgi:hypothetical protein